jgi:hypothetical protein
MGESCGVNSRDPSIRYGSIEMMMHRRLNITAYRYRGCLRSPNRLLERASRDYVRPFSLPFLVLFPPQK